MEARQGCDGEDTQWEGPGVLRGWDPVPEALRVVFNPAPWDSPSPSGLLLAEAGFCPWLGCSPAATSASKGTCLHFSEWPRERARHCNQKFRLVGHCCGPTVPSTLLGAQRG